MIGVPDQSNTSRICIEVMISADVILDNLGPIILIIIHLLKKLSTFSTSAVYRLLLRMRLVAKIRARLVPTTTWRR